MATALVKTADPEKDGHLNTSRPYHPKITARPFLFITQRPPRCYLCGEVTLERHQEQVSRRTACRGSVKGSIVSTTMVTESLTSQSRLVGQQETLTETKRCENPGSAFCTS